MPVSLIKKIFKNEDGSTGTLYLVTNDLESGADQIFEIYQKRWRVEEYHKSIKQNSSLEKSPTRTMRSQKSFICIVDRVLQARIFKDKDPPKSFRSQI